MKLARMGVTAAAIVTLATVVLAQKPDFSGTWTLDPGAASTAGETALGSGPARVKQTADALTIERTAGGANVMLTYKLDGTQSRNIITNSAGEPTDSMSIATWDGPKLTIVTKQEMDGQVVESREVWVVEGNTLSVETTNAGGTHKQVYRK